jgi:signal transduction histidine kinase
MLVEGVEHAGVERERRSGASSVALEFKTPREPLRTTLKPR